MIEDLTFLEEGEFTRIDSTVREYAEAILTSGGGKQDIERFLLSMHDFVQFSYQSGNSEQFRKRTASQILKSGYYNGCTDAGLVFLAISRAAGIPAKYIETFREEWLENPSSPIQGHIFAELFDYKSGKWIKINPPSSRVDEFELLIDREYKKYIEAGAGLDFSEIFPLLDGKYERDSQRVQSYEDIIRLAKTLGGKLK